MTLLEQNAGTPSDIFSVMSLALNIVQTCFLAWLAVYARRP
jgi:hypothetical protein